MEDQRSPAGETGGQGGSHLRGALCCQFLGNSESFQIAHRCKLVYSEHLKSCLDVAHKLRELDHAREVAAATSQLITSQLIISQLIISQLIISQLIISQLIIRVAFCVVVSKAAISFSRCT